MEPPTVQAAPAVPCANDAQRFERVKEVVREVGGGAALIYLLGAFFGAAWPAAVASCGLSLLGIGAVVVLTRRAS
jgi:hypothetical protein